MIIKVHTFFVMQIKGTFHRTYTDAVVNYNAEDEASRAVDNLQHKVSTPNINKVPQLIKL